MSLFLPTFNSIEQYDPYDEAKIEHVTLAGEDRDLSNAKSALDTEDRRVLEKEYQRYLKILFDLTGERLNNVYSDNALVGDA